MLYSKNKLPADVLTYRGAVWGGEVLSVQVARFPLACSFASCTSAGGFFKLLTASCLFWEKWQSPGFPDVLWSQGATWVCSLSLKWCFWRLLLYFSPSSKPKNHPSLAAASLYPSLYTSKGSKCLLFSCVHLSVRNCFILSQVRSC